MICSFIIIVLIIFCSASILNPESENGIHHAEFEDVLPTLLRTTAAQRLLNEAIAAGATSASDHGLRIHQQEPGLDELLRQQILEKMILMERTDHDLYTLTFKGKQCVKHCTKLHSPTPLLAYQRPGLGTDILPEDFTTAELVVLLAQQGWSDKEQRKSTKIEPYSLGQAKLWYHSDNRTISKLYLRTLASTDELLEADVEGSQGMTKIYHWQSQAYYCACLRGIQVLPNQPLAYYKLCIKKHDGVDYKDDGENDDAAAAGGGDDQGRITFEDVST